MYLYKSMDLCINYKLNENLLLYVYVMIMDYFWLCIIEWKIDVFFRFKSCFYGKWLYY